jgi:pre-rRNA-processing protein TSR1
LLGALNACRIFQFEDFARTAKRVVKEARKNAAAVEAGSYVTMYIRDVPLTYTETRRSDVPLVVVGLLQYEGKMSIVNYALKRHAASEDLVVNNKEELVYVTPIRTCVRCTHIM